MKDHSDLQQLEATLKRITKGIKEQREKKPLVFGYVSFDTHSTKQAIRRDILTLRGLLQDLRYELRY